jgi:hypothetical protein
LRTLVEQTLAKHLPAHELEVLEKAEASEREILIDIVRQLTDSPARLRVAGCQRFSEAGELAGSGSGGSSR